MKKLVLGASISGVAVVALGSGFMVMSDRKTDELVEQLTSSVSDPMSVEVVKDDNSFFGRELDFVIQIDDADVDFRIQVENDIQKKPWGTSIQHAFYLDEALLANAPDEEVKAIFSKYFVDQPFLKGQTNVSMNGAYQSQLQTIELDESLESVKFKMDALNIETTGDLSGAMAMSGDWQGAQFELDALELVLVTFNPMTFSADGEYVDNALFVGKQTMAFEGISFNVDSEWDSQSFEMGPILVNSDGKLDGQTYSGDVNVNAKNISFAGKEDALSVESFESTIRIAGIDVKNYKALMDGVNDMQVTGAPTPELLSAGSTFLQNGFELELSKWRASIEQKEIALDAAFSLPENTVADLNNPFSLMGLIGEVNASAKLELDSSLTDVPAVYDALMGLLMTGVLVNNGEKYLMEFSMDQGALTLNGEPMPLPF